jgi:undecaprenyl diphosphate synthase
LAVEQQKPKHLAIIMDGNARWAKQKSLKISEGHQQGIKNIEPVIKYCINQGVKSLTLYSFSVENFTRPKDEVDDLMRAVEHYIENGADEMIKKYQPRIVLLGERSGLKKSLLKKIEYVEKKTKNLNSINLNIAFNYGGQQEIIAMTKRVAQKVKNSDIFIEDINFNLIEDNLYLPKMTAPDLVIRTGGFFRISNFLLWYIAYSELFFTKTLWPNFCKEDLDEAFEDFALRKRNYGGRTQE